MSNIKKYCITNGTVNRFEQNLFEGGSVPGQADISYATGRAYTLMSRGSMSGYQNCGYAASFTGFVYNESIYCLGKAMFQNASGREVSCRQLLLYAKEDLLDGRVFSEEVIRFPFLSVNELLESGDYTKAQIFNRPVRAESEKAILSDAQRNTINRVVFELLHDSRVVLRVPGGEHYEKLSLAVLEAVFQLMPGRDCCEISFTTARNGADIRRLGEAFRLILTDDLTERIGDAEWFDLNDDTPLAQEEMAIAYWGRESLMNRNAVEKRYFTGEAVREMGTRLSADYQILQDLYSPKMLWWKSEQLAPRFSSFSDMLAEYRVNPTLAFPDNRILFFSKISELLNSTGDTVEPDDDRLMSDLEDYLFLQQVRVGGRTISLFEDQRVLEQFYNTCQDEYGWFGRNETWRMAFLDDVKLLQRIFCSENR